MRRLMIAALVVGIILAQGVGNRALAGGTKEITVGVLLGSGVGLSLGGALLLLADTNTKADENLDTFLWVGTGVGAAGGFVMGAFVPEGADFDPGSPALESGARFRLLWPSPYVAPVSQRDEHGVVVGAKLIHIVF